MTKKEPRPQHIGVALYPNQIDLLEGEAEANPEVEDVSELVRLLVADYTGTLDQLRPPKTPNDSTAENIQSIVESQQELLEEISEKIDGEEDAELDAVFQLLDTVRDRQEEVIHELTQHDIL